VGSSYAQAKLIMTMLKFESLASSNWKWEAHIPSEI
jgi:hypothetical protein